MTSKTTRLEPPTVTVGVPVFNERESIEAHLAALRDQSYTNLDIIVCDNASDDGSSELIKSLIPLYSHSFYQQPENLGPWANFVSCLSRSSGEYFLWAAPDDKRSSNFIEKCVDFLEANPDFVGVAAGEQFGQDERLFALDGESVGTRISQFLRNAYRSHGFFYGVFRSSGIEDFPFHERTYFGVDWSFTLWALTKGKIGRIQSAQISIGVIGVSSSPRRYSSFLKGWKARLFPFRELSIEVFSWPQWTFSHRKQLRFFFARQNVSLCIDQARLSFGWLYRRLSGSRCT